MPHALNMTIPLKLDFQSQRKLDLLKVNFAAGIQTAFGNALQQSAIVHFAQVMVIDNRYLQLLIDYDGDRTDFAKFFQQKLLSVLQPMFELGMGGVPNGIANASPEDFAAFLDSFDLRSLGKNDSDQAAGWLFSVFGDKTVKDIAAKLGS